MSWEIGDTVFDKYDGLATIICHIRLYPDGRYGYSTVKDKPIFGIGMFGSNLSSNYMFTRVVLVEKTEPEIYFGSDCRKI